MVAEEADAEALGADDLALGVGEAVGVDRGRVFGVFAEKHRRVGEDQLVERTGDGFTGDVDRELADPEVAGGEDARRHVVGALVGHEPADARGDDDVPAGTGGLFGGIETDLVRGQHGVAIGQPGVARDDGFLGGIVVDEILARQVRRGPGLCRQGEGPDRRQDKHGAKGKKPAGNTGKKHEREVRGGAGRRNEISRGGDGGAEKRH